MKNTQIEPLNSCSPQAAKIKRFDLDFHSCRRADICQYLKNIVSSTKTGPNRARALILGQIDSK